MKNVKMEYVEDGKNDLKRAYFDKLNQKANCNKL